MQRILASLLVLSLITVLTPMTTQPARAGVVCGPMDVTFVIDDTGSMGGAIGNVQSEAAALIDDIDSASGGDYQTALVSFKDHVHVREPLGQRNGEAVRSALLTLSASGGAGLPEASDEALRTVVDGITARGGQTGSFPDAWRTHAQRIVILVTDAPPAGFDDRYTIGTDDINMNQRALDATARGIRVSAVFVPTGGDYNGQRAILQDVATTTSGLYTETASNGAGTGQALRDIIAACGTWCQTLLDPALVTDGMLDGLFGWGDLAYGLTLDEATLADPALMSVRWVFDDIAVDGASVTRTFPLPDPDLAAVIGFVIEIVEDVSARCPDIGVVEHLLGPFVFTALPDLLPTLADLVAGLSCDAGVLVPSWTDLDIIAASCPVRGDLDLRGAPPALLHSFDLVVDGMPVATTTGTTLSHDYLAATVGDGWHSLELCASAVGDVHDRSFCTTPYLHHAMTCTNALPALSAITMDGMGTGSVGWAERLYTLSAAGVQDPDGDPVTVEWHWPDGTSTFGPTVDRWFPEGGHPLSLTLYEDVSARCPLARTAPVTIADDPLLGAPLRFEAIPDWTVTMDKPEAGWSCLAGSYVRSSAVGLPDMMSGRCQVTARVEMAAAQGLVTPSGVLRVDGTPIYETRTSLLSTVYDSLQYSFDEHTIDVCYAAPDDKYGRSFCTDEYVYINIGR